MLRRQLGRFARFACCTLMLSAQAACKKGESAPATTSPIDGAGVPATLVVTSTAFAGGGVIPKTFTCDGDDKSPDLAWTGAPKETKSFALIVDDPDAPGATWTHWVLFDVPASSARLDVGSSVGVSGKNDFGKDAYGGPCPPAGKGAHRYFFKLYALDVDKLGPSAGASRDDVEKAMSSHLLARGELMGKFER